MKRRRKKNTWSLPRIGQRMIKTSAAVLLCLAFYCWRGYRGEDMPTEAAITAIICMQPYVQDSRLYALNRMTGTLIGAGWGLFLLLILLLFPPLGTNLYILYPLMALGVLLSLYTTVVFRKPDASSLAAIVFICVVVNFPDIEEPLRQALDRVLGVMVGTAAAIGINVIRLPRRWDRNRVFFLRSSDLVPDRFAQISPAVLFRLNDLCQNGAKICLISRHAPAFFAPQLNSTALRLPMIVMDGAALYDVTENRYLEAAYIREADSAKLLDRLDRLGRSYFLYTIHRNRTCIFHRGLLQPLEMEVLRRLKRSPYRSYLDEEVYAPEDLVCVKILGLDADIQQLQNQLHTFVRGRRMRTAVQPQADVPGVSGLYIYSQQATVNHAENRLLRYLCQEQPDLTAEELFLPDGYHSEHDAMHLLYRVLNRAAPIRFLPVRRRGD
ncbi:MAG: FUSC family protein [Oscillibacter sp.]|nr:FUSC family protein [Oscillibacter sp.]